MRPLHTHLCLAARRRPVRRAAISIWLAVAVAGVAACSATARPTGTLEGHVTIGPLVPVVRQGEPEPTPAPEVYAARQIVVLTRDGQTEVARAQVDAEGDYRVALPPGTYVVDINHAGIDRAADLPKTVQISAGQVTRLDIDIDTGIR
jgi:hypothetical protein